MSPVVSLTFVIPSVGVISLSFLGAGVVLYMWDATVPVCFFTCLFSEFIFSAAGGIFKHFLFFFFKVVAVF